jgi:nucleoside diphosphate kinase
MDIISEREAKMLGLGRLTTHYRLPREQRILGNVVEDMRRGNIQHAVVEVAYGVEVWRANIRRSGQFYWDE